MTDSPKNPVRVRIAPSPTGPLHLGTARTALFNWLFAKKHGGKFIVRIEDTDLERSDPKFEKDILEGLRWLGLDWDEGPDKEGEYGHYRQSERSDSYEKYIRQLLDRNLAYYCFCTKEQLEEERQAMLAQGQPPKYSGRCKKLSAEETSQKLENESSIIRFKVSEIKIAFNDMIRGKITFDASLIGDIAIAKYPPPSAPTGGGGRRTAAPLYNFAVVIDDHEMAISHVIRGEDHIANTPKQILIQEALGFERPEYAHLPLLLSPDRSKLSKRYLETSIDDYRREGYLPEALINFLALLGWHPAPEKDPTTGKVIEREIFSKEGLVEVFDLKRVQKQGAAFNIEKLDWLNNHYIKSTDDKQLLKYLKTFVPKKWLSSAGGEEKLAAILEIEKERMKKLSDFSKLAGFLIELPEYKADLLIWKNTPREKILANLQTLETMLKEKAAENAIMQFAEKEGRGQVLWPLRVALSGSMASPGPFEIMKVIGREESVKRIQTAVKKLGS
ncbi:MAG: glutamate--tRNA ligase [Parcubacteria group bacterium]|nr:glutamate--tRNA ligase [Parcubacteria group bacterium]